MAEALQGGAALEAKLKRLGGPESKKIIKKAVRVGAKVVLKAARANAKSMVGGDMGKLISRNLQVRAHKKQRRGSYIVGVQIKPGVDEFVHKPESGGGQTYIPAAIEYGHDGPGGEHVAAVPFMRKASDTTKPTAIKATTDEIARGIKKAALKG